MYTNFSSVNRFFEKHKLLLEKKIINLADLTLKVSGAGDALPNKAVSGEMPHKGTMSQTGCRSAPPLQSSLYQYFCQQQRSSLSVPSIVLVEQWPS